MAAEPTDRPLSPGQQALWLLQRLAPANVAYVIAGAARVRGALDGAALRGALADLGARHEALRTTFHDGPGGPVLRVHSVPAPELLGFEGGTACEPEAWSAFAFRPFDLERGPLVRLGVFQDGAGTVLVLAVHHIVADFWSLGLMVRELGALYGERAGAGPAGLPALELTPSEWAARQLAGGEGARLETEWRQALDGVPLVLDLPSDRPRPPLQSYAGTSVTWGLDADLAAAVARFGRRRGATLSTTLLAAFQALLARWSGQERLVVGVPTSGRRSREVAGLVGYFVNPVPVAADLRSRDGGAGPGFEELLGRVKESARAAFDRQDYPFALLTERLQPERDPSRSPVFQAMFVLQKGRKAGEEAIAALSVGAAGTGSEDVPALRAGPLALQPVALPDPGAQFDVSLAVAEIAGRLVGRWQVNRDLFDRVTAERWGRQLGRLLALAVEAPAAPLAGLALLAEAERHQVLVEWNAAPDLPEQSGQELALLHAGFLEQARRDPAATALVAGRDRLSYGELAARSAGLARRLRGLGVGPEVRVGVLCGRDAGLVVALLGVLRAGGAYVPLDPAYPEERLRFMLEDSAAPVVLTRGDLRGRLGGYGGVVVEADGDRTSGTGGSAVDLPPASPGHLSHVIYTSGSTGRPKGVAIEHRASAAFVRWALGAFSRAELAGVLAATSVCFDLSVFELFAPLSAGGTVVLVENALALPELSEDIEVTLVNTVPSAMAELVRSGSLPDSVLTVNLAGEPLPRPLVDGIYETSRGTSRVRRVLNLYGPTEDTTYSTIQEVRPGEAGEPPIGRPIAGGFAVVLARDGHPVIRGAVGELCLGGAGLARGYLGRPDLTAERFVPSGFDRNGEAGARLYRTGDLVRQTAAGSLVYLGRIDHQVKVRGFRIEMGEVEAALRALPGVREAVVVVRDAPSGPGLAAYLAGDLAGEGSGQRLREALASRLPGYMVPAWIVVLPALPLTPNGKVDRRALPAPSMALHEARDAAARPRTPTEELLAGVWAELLGLPPGSTGIAPQDSFFHLGGHSLLAAQALSRVREALGVEIGLARFFEAPTLAGLAAEVDRRRAAAGGAMPAPPLAPVSRVGPLPLAPAQERLWFLDQREPGSSAYNIPGAVRLRGELDVPALGGALAGIVARHEALRTRFGVADARPVQVIRPAAESGLALPVADLAALGPAAREAELLRLAAAEAARPFDLAAGPLLRVLLVRLACLARLVRPAPGTPPEAEHALLITLHHIVGDGWSLGVFVRELAALYGAARAPREAGPALPPLALQYADFAVWQRRWLEEEGELERQLAFWRPCLAGAPAVLDLPLDRPRSAAGNWDGRGARLTLRLAAAEMQAAAELARAEGATLFLVLLAALDALLLRHTGQEDLVVGSPVAGRDRLELEPLIGLFVNTLVLRCDAGGDPAVRELLARVRAAALGAWAHQDVPFDRLVEAVAPQRDASHTPLFQVMLAAQPDVLGGSGGLAGLALAPLAVPVASAKFDLAVGIVEEGGGMALHWVYRTALFDAPTVARLAAQFGRLLAGAAAGPERRLSALPVLAAAERHQLVHEWDGLTVEPEGEALRLTHELIAEQVRRRPGAPALEMAGALPGSRRVLTYGELDAAAERLARRLRRLGIGPEDRVGVFLERSFETIAGLLAMLRTGAAFVPLDPALPAERLAFLLDDARPAALLTQAHLAARLAESLTAAAAGLPVLRVDAPEEGGEAADGAPAPPDPIDPLAAAYVIYTSGSTGQAKGVMVSHGALGRRIRTYAAELDAPARFLHKTTLSFDASVGEIFGPLAAGGTLVLAVAGGERDQGYLVGLMREMDVTYVSFTASTLGVMVEQPGFGECRSLRTVMVGAETVPADLPGRFAARLGVRLLNRYGPTETTISVISGRCDPGAAPGADRPGLPPPLGRPIPGAGILLLDRRLEPVPARALGEICVGGGYLARGYLGRPDLTAERFVPHPFSPAPGGRLYRTGDLARFLADGRLEFVGRADQQVKIRGFRVELGEIEAVLAAHPGVREAVVAARPRRDRTTDLVAYVVPHAGAGAFDAGVLRELVRGRLPAYMVPAAFVLLERLPLSPSGKVDRRALPAPDTLETAAKDDRFVAPATPVEQALAAIWREVLGVSRVGVGDSFFELGGHSLQVTQVLLRVRDLFGVEITVQRFFDAPTVADLALALAEELMRQAGAEQAAEVLGDLPPAGPGPAPVRPPVLPAPRVLPPPLSCAQERLWFLHQLDPGSAAYNQAAAVRLTGGLDRAALAAALSGIVRRHEALRTTLAPGADGPVQVIAPPAAVDLPVRDLSAEARPEERAREAAAREAARPFDLAAGPLLRPLLLRLSAGEHVLVVTLHHVISDGWSVGILVRELAALYGAFGEERAELALPALPVQYADYAVWQRQWLAGGAPAAELGWWRERLAGAPAVLELPADRPRPAVQSLRGGSAPVALGEGLTGALAALARRHGATLFMALLAGFQALLARYGSGEDLPVGSPVAGRAGAELEALIGCFVNTLVLRGDLTGDPGFGDLLVRTRQTAIGAFAHQDLPFEKLVEALHPERSRAHAPLFQVMLALQNAPAGELRLPGLVLARLELATTGAPFDLTLDLREAPGGVRGALIYARDLFDEATAERLVHHLGALLAAAVADPQGRLGDLPLLAGGELAQLLAAAAGEPGSGGGPWVHRQVLARAAEAPDALAVSGEGEALTYGELALRARRLAARLRGLGVGPEVPVGLLLPRSPAFAAAALGVLAAGGVCLPLDPALPPHRLALLAGDAGCRVLVTRQDLAGRLAPGGAGVTLLLAEEVLGGAPEGRAGRAPAPVDIDVETDAASPAYLIYTSGSSGTPKGIAVLHGAFANLAGWYARTFGVDAGARAVAVAGVGFDAAALELWGHLCAGASVWIPAPELVPDPPALLAWMAQRRITHALLTAAVVELVLREPLPAGLALRVLFSGGDRLYARPPAGAPFRLFNCYGPTEATVIATAGEVAAAPAGGTAWPDVGRPISGTRAHVLDRGLRPLPAGAPGELCLAGAGLARGYAGRPGLTAAAFVPDPFAGGGERLYRTGDRVRWAAGADGGPVLEFLGRLDQQVKVRGFRIEPGEIEAALAAHPGVREAAVVLREGRQGEKRLVAYVAGAAGEAELRAHLAARLPAYMVPAAIVAVAALPLTANGKVDRRALPEPGAASGDAAGPGFAEPGTELEQTLAGIWHEVLEAPRIGIRDSFFDLGGHSLQVTRMLARVKLAFEVEVPLALFFENPTIEGLALAVAGELMDGLGDDKLAEILSEVTAAAEAPLRTAGAGGASGLPGHKA